MMRWILVLFTLLSLLLLGLAGTGAGAERSPGDPVTGQRASTPPPKGGFKEGQVIVKYKSKVSVSTVERLARGVGDRQPSRPKATNARLLKVPAKSELQVIQELKADPNVEYAEPNYLCYAFRTPNDPSVSLGYQWNLSRIRAFDAWDISTGSDVKIAIIDTGVSRTHPDLLGKVVWGARYADGVSSENWADDNGHGTHVAGIAGAVTNNNVGVAGVSWQASLLAIKVLDSSGAGTYHDAALGIVAAADQGARVINCSFGGDTYSQELADAIKYAQDRGVLVVAASGNGNLGAPVYPAAYPGVVAVGATDQLDQRASYSNYGSHLWVAAPGGDPSADPSGCVYSTWWSPANGDSYDWQAGTSMAAAHVSGLAALIWSVNPSLSPAEVRDVLRATATDLGEAGWDQYYGWGRIDALAALQFVSRPYRVYLPVVLRNWPGQ